MTRNIDQKVVNDFGREWELYDQAAVPADELQKSFDQYYSLFPWSALPADAQGFDMGCGSGRWALLCAPRVGSLHCIDPAKPALDVAKRKLAHLGNCVFHNVSVDELPFADGSMDFGYSLGVLHHIPDTKKGLLNCVKKLKPGAPFLLYLYYAFDNRPAWFKLMWQASDLVRRFVSVLPHSGKSLVSWLIALLVYLPLSRLARLFEGLGFEIDGFPLSAYRDKGWYTLKTDALDRFGTRLERRFTQEQIREMMSDVGLENIEIRDGVPRWCAIGFKSVSGPAASGT